MAKIEVEVKVHLPYDAQGVTALPGQVITVDTDLPIIRGYLETGLLYPLEPLEFPVELKPPVAPDQDAADDQAAADADGVTVGPIPDAPQHAAQAEDTSRPTVGLLPPYEKDTVEQLRNEIDGRGLEQPPSSAVKAELIELLELDDQTR